MRQRRRPIKFLLLSLLLLFLLSLLIYFLPPNFKFSIFNIEFMVLQFFLFLLLLFLFAFGSFLFKSKKRGILIALFGVSYFLFRLNNLTHPFFLLLLISLFLALELLFSYRK